MKSDVHLMSIWFIGLIFFSLGSYMSPSLYSETSDSRYQSLTYTLYAIAVIINFTVGYFISFKADRPLLKYKLGRIVLYMSMLLTGMLLSFLNFWIGIWFFYP